MLTVQNYRFSYYVDINRSLIAGVSLEHSENDFESQYLFYIRTQESFEEQFEKSFTSLKVALDYANAALKGWEFKDLAIQFQEHKLKKNQSSECSHCNNHEQAPI